ncbi:protoheme IX farnesyltransferase [Candidatus Marinamargulisbacteria bacterium SCGC AG-410-N11]|nr:protoheme IX farnesyltransferase [Candidatus Marinamargulisbacteria bacterium SCGC AG-410-N11]
MKKILIYFELLKLRILINALITFTIGFILASNNSFSFNQLIILLLAMFLVFGGSASLNHVTDRKVDKIMDRTKNRPIPSGAISVKAATILSGLLLLAGFMILFFVVNTLTLILAILLVFMYNIVYGYLKHVSWLNTFVGAIPGALPPLCGWTVITGNINLHAICLFLIFYFWQLPHFFSIDWIYRDSYQSAGIRMLSGIDKAGVKTANLTFITSIILAIATIFPYIIGQLGLIYMILAVFLNIYFISQCWFFLKGVTNNNAKKVMYASIIYQLILVLGMYLDILV